LDESLVEEALRVLRSIGRDRDAMSPESDEGTRATALAEFAEGLPDPAQSAVKAEALATADAIEDQYWRAIALSQLAEHLPEALLDEAVEAAAKIQSDAARLRILSRLTPYRDRVGAATLAAEVHSTLPSDEAVEALEALIPHLPEQALTETLAVVRSIDDPSVYLNGLFAAALSRLLALAADRSGDDCLQLLAKAIELPSQINNEWLRAAALAQLAPKLPEAMLRKLLASTKTIADVLPRAQALTRLVPHLPEADRARVVAEALMALRTAIRSYEADDILSALASWLSRRQLEETLPTLDPSQYAGALATFARRMATLGETETALELVRATEDATTQVSMLAALTEELPEEALPRLRAEVAATLRRIQPVSMQAWVLLELVTARPGKGWGALLPDVASAARKIEDPIERIRLLNMLLPHLSDQERSLLVDEVNTAAYEASKAAHALRPGRDRAVALAAVAPSLPDPDRRSALSEALRSVQDIQDSHQRSWTLLDLASALPTQLLGQALSTATQITDEQSRANALQGLAPRLPEPLLREAIAATAEFNSEYWQSQALSPLLARLAALGHVEESLERAGSIGIDSAAALAGIAPHLPATLIEVALEVVRSLDDAIEFERSKALAALLARQADLGFADAALEETASISGTEDRAVILADIAERLANAPPPGLYESWCRLLRRLSDRPRSDLLSDIGVLAPLLVNLGGTTTVVGIADAIIETGSWFP
jgi:hypothetical protein